MHGRRGDKGKGTRHMWKAPTRGDSSVNADVSSSSSASSTVKSFFKYGRRISVGDCALFKPSEDRPPFVGIIRCLSLGKEKILKLGVSWLYRSIEVKLSKGVPLKGAPNELFYTFHKDEIDAESLLHPCKVSFLPKGAELPPGISSFVCRRVYDIANKCLWWLNDQDYVNDCQEEVDQLLYRTCVEMHATVQPGGRSPKPMNSPTSTSQLKSVSDSVQNSTSSIPSHIKGRKRERADQGSEPVKRERSIKTEDGDPGNFRYDNILKTEIAKITEKGGLVDSEGVEKLVQLMTPDRNEKKIDLASRSLLAAVIAATDKLDCLSQFVQLRGLPVFDEWLQEVHKGKIGDGVVSRDGDKSAEEFLLVLLRALDKLPVNLQALQKCNIGKSVNHLRTHKNTEIQRKARGLIDTWKKRVEAEMNINDAKSGSGPTVHWPSKSRPSDVGQGGNRHSGASSDVAMKSSVTHLSTSKTASVKIVQGENATRSTFPGAAKSVPSPASATTNLKDVQPRNAAVNGGTDLPLANGRDEKSSSSSQSHNNSQSCSSDHAKTGGHSGKEDARSSTAMSANKISGGSSRHRKSVNGFSGSTPSGGQREAGSSRNSSLHKNLTSEKLSQPGLLEKAPDGTSLEGNTPKLIVKIPNQGRSPAQSASAGSFEDPTIMNSRASSPVLAEKHDQFDHSSKEKSDLYRANVGSDINTESWQSNDFKDVLTGSDEGDGSPAAVTDEERCRTSNDCKKTLEASKAASSSSGNENKAGNLQDASYSSMNALIEGVKYSEADDVGMNLLASVAAGEILKSELLTPAGSPERNTTAVEQSCTGNDVVKSSEENLVRDECQSNNGLDGEHKNRGSVTGDLGANDESDSDVQASGGKTARELNQHANACGMDSQLVSETILGSKGKLNEKSASASLVGICESSIQEAQEGGRSKQLQEVAQGAGEILHVKVSCVAEVEAEPTEKVSHHIAVEGDVRSDNCTFEGKSGDQTAKKPPAIVVQSDSARGNDENVLQGCGVDKIPEDFTERDSEKADVVNAESHSNQSKEQRNECESVALTMPENRGLSSTVTGPTAEHVEENLGIKDIHDQPAREERTKVSLGVRSLEIDKHRDSKGSKVTTMEAEEAEECTSTTADASSLSAAAVSDADAKVGFDLNEGLNTDDGKCAEFNSLTTSGCAPAGRLISPVPFPASSMSSGIPAPVTVASAAKRPFVPPEDLLRSKGEIGWKGSAATSAFRPAEPRKVVEMPLGTINTPTSDAPSGKQNRAPLDIDLNVADERILDDISSQTGARRTEFVSLATDGYDPVSSKMASPVRCSGGLGLDLNQVDDASDVGNCLSSNQKIDVPIVQVKSSLGGPPNREVNIHRDFDLNNGPSVDEVTTESSLFPQHARSSVPSQPPFSGHRATAEPGNFSSWLPSSGNTYSAVTISSIMPDRADQPFSIVAPNGPQRLLTPAGGNPFGPDIYRGPVLSSSPAVSYASAPFEYPVFPFNSSFPLPSASFSAGSTTYVYPTSGNRLCFPAVNSQLMGTAGTVSSHYPRPYVVGLTEASNSGSAEPSRKWARQGLDLNAGPGGSDIEGRDESSSRQLSVASSQALAEEQAMIQLASIRKRKEPDGGWDGYNQSSWQ
ncbi:hypothetical protein VNO78_02583 [Psophocarpus tetragonolobus]|uniref:Uncharacterized protein n=1 Tax=Psophocarpus tetragonolobus TaxID=3891 RepID=A0AAN9XV57_PSOTE